MKKSFSEGKKKKKAYLHRYKLLLQPGTALTSLKISVNLEKSFE